MTVQAGKYRQIVTLANPGPAVSNGDGGFTQTPVPLVPGTMPCRVYRPSARDLERLRAGTSIATATHVVEMRYHAGVTTKTVVTFKGRTLNVSDVIDVEERGIELNLLCVEVVA
jgi:SPP1 family predicted phage head-tail adaptor